MEPETFRIICGVLSVVLLGLIVMRRKSREID